jgi:P-type E1-E2 ATPase
MITIDIPGFRQLQLQHLVLDYNGTIAIDGILISGVPDVLRALSAELQIHVITADTFGVAAQQLSSLPVTLTIIPLHDQAQAKLHYLNQLGADSVFAIGNGRNDQQMLKAAAVGVAIIQKEGGAAQAIASADVVCCSILDALDLLSQPKRLIATLRT